MITGNTRPNITLIIGEQGPTRRVRTWKVLICQPALSTSPGKESTQGGLWSMTNQTP